MLDLLCHALSSVTNSALRHENGTARSRTALDGRLSRCLGPSQADPLGSYTPEVDQALADAQDARARSAYLRKELREAIERTEKLQKAAHKSVNDGMTQKLSETITLKVTCPMTKKSLLLRHLFFSVGNCFQHMKILDTGDFSLIWGIIFSQIAT